MRINIDLIIKVLGTLSLPMRIVPWKVLVNILTLEIISFSFSRNPKEKLLMLLELERRLYQLTSKAAIKYDNGIHPKHRLTNYHEFFIRRLNKGERVIDIGCGNGDLSYDIALAGAKVTGMEINDKSYNRAINRYKLRNLQFIQGDVLTSLPTERFDVAVMSNVLEHIMNRVEFLTRARKIIRPKKWLLRVPLYERDWRVPLMKEVGIEYRLDKTHYTEYTIEEFESELEESGLKITYKEIRWGEIWCEAVPINEQY